MPIWLKKKIVRLFEKMYRFDSAILYFTVHRFYRKFCIGKRFESAILVFLVGRISVNLINESEKLFCQIVKHSISKSKCGPYVI